MDKIQINFEKFHRENPQIYEMWDRFTRQMITRGFQRGSASLIAERIRWETGVETTGSSLKMPNNYRSRYARLWEARNPLYEGYFRKCKLRANSLDSNRMGEPE